MTHVHVDQVLLKLENGIIVPNYCCFSKTRDQEGAALTPAANDVMRLKHPCQI